VLGFQQIRRPNFDRHGAWLTMGNIELHLIKGNPVVFEGDSLIVGHISLETDYPEEVLRRLNQMGVKFTKNVSVPDAKGVTPITQYFLRDPDGYYIELCNCDILTKFCLGKDEIGIHYGEAVEHVDLSKIFLLSLLIDESKKRAIGCDTPLPQDQWAAQADPVKLANLLSRCRIWGDVAQGETEQSISLALRQANNNVPRATRILKANKGGGEVFVPPAVIIQGETRYQPTAVQVRRKEKGQPPLKISSLVELAAKMFKEIDKDGSGTITKVELKKLLLKLHQNPTEEALNKLMSSVDTNHDGVLDFDEFLDCISKGSSSASEWDSFFRLLDIDGNGKITAPEMCSILRSIGYSFSDEDIDIIFTEFDADGNGSLSPDEIKEIINKLL